MKKFQLMVDIAESSANIADIESDTGCKLPESTSIPKLEVVSLKQRFLEHWSDSYKAPTNRYEV